MDVRSCLPSVLAATSLDAHVLNSVTAQFVATCLSIVCSDTVSKFHRGVMPGDSEVDRQFTLVISTLLNTLRTQLAMEGIEASIPAEEAILSAQRDTHSTWNMDVSYVDDIALAIPLHAEPGHQHSPKHYSCAPSCDSAIFDNSSTCLLEKTRLWWMPSVLVRVLYAWLSDASVQCQFC